MNNYNAKIAIIVLFGLLIAALSGHFKFLPGLVFSLLIFISVIHINYKNELRKVIIQNKVIKLLFLTQAFLNLIMVVVAFVFLIEVTFSWRLIGNWFNYIILSATYLNLIITFVGAKIRKKDLNTQQ